MSAEPIARLDCSDRSWLFSDRWIVACIQIYRYITDTIRSDGIVTERNVLRTQSAEGERFLTRDVLDFLTDEKLITVVGTTTHELEFRIFGEAKREKHSNEVCTRSDLSIHAQPKD